MPRYRDRRVKPGDDGDEVHLIRTGPQTSPLVWLDDAPTALTLLADQRSDRRPKSPLGEAMHTYSILIFVLVTVAIVAITSIHTRIPVAILLVVAGLLISLMPGLPRVELSPELVLLFVVPPPIYSAGVAMSWREFRYNIRSISLLAFGGVAFSTIAVAAVVHFMLGWDWSIGFVLGAIIAPPDEVAPMAIARRLGMPRRTMVVIEGEGLANDACALILYRFAVAAVSLGTFSFGTAALVFVAIMIGELAWGLAVGYLSLRLRRWAKDARVEIILSLLTPFAAYWPPEALGGSGVLATVVCGLYISWNGPLLIPSHSGCRASSSGTSSSFSSRVAMSAHGLESTAAARPRRPGDGGGVRDRRVGDDGRDRRRALHVGVPSLYLARLLLRRCGASITIRSGNGRSGIVLCVRGIVSLAAALALPLHDGDRHARFPIAT